jgi:hypothetical protein
MKLKIISDGYCKGTKVVNEETGEELRGVTKIEWFLSVDSEIATARITLVATKVEVLAKLESFILPPRYENTQIPREQEALPAEREASSEDTQR